MELLILSLGVVDLAFTPNGALTPDMVDRIGKVLGEARKVPLPLPLTIALLGAAMKSGESYGAVVLDAKMRGIKILAGM